MDSLGTGTLQAATLSPGCLHVCTAASELGAVLLSALVSPPALASGPLSCEWPTSACWKLQERGM